MRNHHRIAAVAFGLILGGFVRPLAADPIPLNAAVTTAPGGFPLQPANNSPTNAETSSGTPVAKTLCIQDRLGHE